MIYIEICYTKTLGAYGPLVLDPAEGMGALRAPYFFVSDLLRNLM